MEQEWWEARGVAGNVLWSHNVAFQSADFEEPEQTEEVPRTAGEYDSSGSAVEDESGLDAGRGQ